ncbi:DsrE family protein [Bradyrhizobium septentrionale]|uniref:DsrE family protein n=1 Tax=Bradyrhizobium septentrionale TaxID=1404411 RepID=A0A974A5G9_9BRAD|nr:DsrE family protein [Bradyrhizobium septentrionale]UGY17357.1 DsrE family protein [Bradyrhizobium septentrionale]UGY26100.1 DsrE family protein [Bradyrhizobium septentrionale]
MRVFQHTARVAIIGAVAVVLATSFAAAQQSGGRYWTPGTTNPAVDSKQIAESKTLKHRAAKQKRERSPLSANARLQPDSKPHRLILQVNTNDPAAMNLALNNATNVAQYYKDLGEKVKIEVVTFGPGLHMLRDDTSPVKSRIEELALSTPEIAFKACGNTQEKMHNAEKKDIPIIRQAEVVKSGVVRVMELQEKGWSYVKP